MNVNGEDEREFDSEAVFWGQWQVCKNETESEKTWKNDPQHLLETALWNKRYKKEHSIFFLLKIHTHFQKLTSALKRMTLKKEGKKAESLHIKNSFLALLSLCAFLQFLGRNHHRHSYFSFFSKTKRREVLKRILTLETESAFKTHFPPLKWYVKVYLTILAGRNMTCLQNALLNNAKRKI